MASWAQLGFQDAQSPVIEEFVFFHDFAIRIIILIFVRVGGALGGGLVGLRISKGILEGQALEIV
jgi:hypothetical protein